MGVDTQKYIRKPLYVDAVRVTVDNFDEVVAWCQGDVESEEVPPGSGTIKKFIKVRVNNPKNPRQTKAFVGDWILYTDRGYKVYTNKPFRAAFDLVDEEAAEGVVTPATPIQQVYINNSEQIPKFYLDPNSDELTETPPGEHAQPLSLDELMNIIRNELVGAELTTSIKDEAQEVFEETPIAPPPTPAIVPPETTGRRILSEEEQNQMTPGEVQELVRSGQVVLAQDLAESA